MADTSVVAGASRADGSIPYELGKPNWQARTIPDIRNPSSSVQIGESRLLDVLILGDGFLTQAEFEEGLQDWIDVFYGLKVYDVFQGAFRIRGRYRESSERASADRDSYYRVRSPATMRKWPRRLVGRDKGDGLEFRPVACSRMSIRFRISIFDGTRAVSASTNRIPRSATGCSACTAISSSPCSCAPIPRRDLPEGLFGWRVRRRTTRVWYELERGRISSMSSATRSACYRMSTSTNVRASRLGRTQHGGAC